MRISEAFLRKLERALPLSEHEGIPLREIMRRIRNARCNRTVRHALAELVAQERIIYTGRDKARLYKLPAPPASVGAPATSPAGVSSLKLAAGPKGPAAFSATPTAEELQSLVDAGEGDRAIGERYGRSHYWAWTLRKKYGIARPSELEPPIRLLPLCSAQEYAEKMTALGGYDKVSDQELAREDALEELALRRRPRVRNVTASFFGDPPSRRRTA